eukprot:Tbor_TRINITY_DN6183_c5_g1::TRINITY_DN6183_c5_g1_i1::g.22282::m.22282/K01673/cynT, can; carbonic anhydrase
MSSLESLERHPTCSSIIREASQVVLRTAAQQSNTNNNINNNTNNTEGNGIVINPIPPRGADVSRLLEYNKNWSASIQAVDSDYFNRLSRQQTPQYLWIGCSDSRVPANQILGLAPGEVFVHRNVANIISRVDLNCLSVVQFAVECLRIERVIVCGHYGCGGVRAVYDGARLGLVDNWLMNIKDISNRYQGLLSRVPEEKRFDALCQLNVICQVRNVAETTIMQDWWEGYNRQENNNNN